MRRPTDLESRLTWWKTDKILRIIIGRSLHRIDFIPKLGSFKTWSGHSSQIVEPTMISKINNSRSMISSLKTPFLIWKKSRSSSRELRITRSGQNHISFGWSTKTVTTWRTVMRCELMPKRIMLKTRRELPNSWSKRSKCCSIDFNKRTRQRRKWRIC